MSNLLNKFKAQFEKKGNNTSSSSLAAIRNEVKNSIKATETTHVPSGKVGFKRSSLVQNLKKQERMRNANNLMHSAEDVFNSFKQIEDQSCESENMFSDELENVINKETNHPISLKKGKKNNFLSSGISETNQNKAKSLFEEKIEKASLDFLGETELRDDANDIVLEKKRIIRKKEDVKKTEETFYHRVKSFFRYDPLFLKPLPNKLYHPLNVFFSLLVIYLFWKGLNVYLDLNSVLNSIMLYLLVLFVGCYFVYFNEPVSKLILLVWQSKKKKNPIDKKEVKKLFSHVLNETELKLLMVAIFSLLLSYINIGEVLIFGGIGLLVSVTSSVILLTKRHFISTCVGVFSALLVFITPVQVVDWRTMEVKPVKLVTSYFLKDRHIERLPTDFNITINDVYVLNRDYIPVYYSFKVHINMTKSLIYSMKLTKCMVNPKDNCENIKKPSENSMWQPLSLVYENKVYPITNFADYKFYIQTLLKPKVKQIMEKRVSSLTLPIRIDRYKSVLPAQIMMDLTMNDLKILGTPELQFSLLNLTLRK